MTILITGIEGQLGKALNKNKLELEKYQELEIFNSVKSETPSSNFLFISSYSRLSLDFIVGSRFLDKSRSNLFFKATLLEGK